VTPKKTKNKKQKEKRSGASEIPSGPLPMSLTWVCHCALKNILKFSTLSKNII
jgi:hypothetical protein